jgi:FixJ family two-component response regulator
MKRVMLNLIGNCCQAANNIAHALKRGANRFLTKPMDFPQLTLSVTAAIARA